MGDVKLLSRYRGAIANDVVNAVVFAIGRLGGAAHLSSIINAVREASSITISDSANLDLNVEAVLLEHDLANPERTGAALFLRPFGEQSRRWALHLGGAAGSTSRATIRP
jgi:hypothetical protein